MTYPTVDATATSNPASSATPTHNVATASEGDLLMMVISIDSDPVGWTTPSGWTQLGSDTTHSTNSLKVLYKTAGASEPSTVDLSFSFARVTVSCCYAISGWTGTPEISTVATNVTADTSPDPSSGTPSWGAKDTLWIACHASGDDNADTNTFPTNYGGSNISIKASKAANDDPSCAMGTRNLNDTTDDPGVFALSTPEFWYAFTLMVEPSVTGGTTDVNYRGTGRGIMRGVMRGTG